MLLKLLLAFTLIPLVEIYLLIKLGQNFGAITSILLVIFTGILGAYLARMEGLRTLFRIQETMREGRMPGEELLDALLIAIAGLVLITPGFITDVAGFLLLFPFTRMLAKKWLKERMRPKSTFRDDDDVIIHQ
ncbi:MAG: FxsA family protein [bacterium]